MNVTEAEAVTKWCPQSRVAFMGESGNRVSSERLRAAAAESKRTGDSRDLEFYVQRLKDTHCIGSLCMWWKFTGYRRVPGGNDEAHGTCGAAPDIAQ